VETLFTNYLMHGTAATTVEILCLLGLPCVLSGNLVQIETGILDIDEACSGIRSLQAMVMIGLFLGELFRLHPWRRVFLLVLGLAVTLAANVVRTTVLASIGIHEGMEAVDRYHDAAGLTVLLFSLSITLIVAQLLRPANLSAPASSSKRTVSLPPLPLQVCAAFLLWFLAGEVLVEAWYRVREPRWQGWSWSVQWPNQNPTFQVNKIPDRSLRLLMCDASESARWTESDGGEWSAYWIRWNPGNAAAATARVHRPEVCLNAEGAVLEKDRGLQPLAVDQLQLPFHAYIFRLRQRVLHVFFCLYEEIPGSFEPERYAPDGMIHLILRAFQGRRNVGQQSLEVALSGYPSDQAAQKVFQTRIRQYLRTGKTAD
jgi:exosortase/archaeosortase family protein